jgi:hypothetical protein
LAVVLVSWFFKNFLVLGEIFFCAETFSGLFLLLPMQSNARKLDQNKGLSLAGACEAAGCGLRAAAAGLLALRPCGCGPAQLSSSERLSWQGQGGA